MTVGNSSRVALLMLLAAGCLEPTVELEPDAGVRDAGPSGVDAGVLDAGVLDAGVLDAGVMDAGVMDAGAIDSGTNDAGTIDAGVIDAGEVDAGEVDAGVVDAGVVDAGVVDAGEVDAGVDAGAPDAGIGPFGVYDFAFICTSGCSGTYLHTMTITQFDPSTGMFSGSGVYNADPRYYWTMNGVSTPPNVRFTNVYQGLNPGYVNQQTGTSDATGANMSGTGTSSQNQTYLWTATRRP